MRTSQELSLALVTEAFEQVLSTPCQTNLTALPGRDLAILEANLVHLFETPPEVVDPVEQMRHLAIFRAGLAAAIEHLRSEATSR